MTPETLKKRAPWEEGGVTTIEKSLREGGDERSARDFAASLNDARERLEEEILFGEGGTPEDLEKKWEEYLGENREAIMDNFRESVERLSDEDLETVGSYLDERIRGLEQKKEEGGASLQEAMGDHITLFLTRRYERAGTEFENKLKNPADLLLGKLEKADVKQVKTEADLQKVMEGLRKNKEDLLATFEEVAELKDPETGELDPAVIEKIDKYLESFENRVRELAGLESPAEAVPEKRAEIVDIGSQAYEQQRDDLLGLLEELKEQGIPGGQISALRERLENLASGAKDKGEKIDPVKMAKELVGFIRGKTYPEIRRQLKEDEEVQRRLKAEKSRVKQEAIVSQLADAKLSKLEDELREKLQLVIDSAENLGGKTGKKRERTAA